MAKFYITTPIYYVNDKASIGHAYTTVLGDVLVRWNRLKGNKSFYLTGLDENSQKTVDAAKKLGVRDIKKYTDGMAKKWKDVWKKLSISNDDFIRTTEPRHKKAVEEFFDKVYKKGDIYKGKYEGLYCEGCEAFLTEKDLVNGECPLHKKKPKFISEENYFFKLTKYQDKVLNHIKKNKNFILPKTRRNEVISFLKEGVRDISISRPDVEWGIPLPIDKKHHFWVWFDALVNYISGSNKNWPAELHLLAKDILRFHCIIWPAMLISAGYKLPKSFFVHGFLTIDGHKMSKSLGNAIDPIYLVDKYGVDPIRYYLVKFIPFGEDGNFSEEKLKDALNNELANDLGNLLSRTLTLVEKQFNGKVKKGKVDKKLKVNLDKIDKLISKYELHLALEEIWKFIRSVNKYVNDKKPWENKNEDILYTLLESLRVISILLEPFIPETCGKINKQLGIAKGNLKEVKFGLVKQYKVKKGEILFKKI